LAAHIEEMEHAIEMTQWRDRPWLATVIDRRRGAAATFVTHQAKPAIGAEHRLTNGSCAAVIHHAALDQAHDTSLKSLPTALPACRAHRATAGFMF
jgi:hypothetical protein